MLRVLQSRCLQYSGFGGLSQATLCGGGLAALEANAQHEALRDRSPTAFQAAAAKYSSGAQTSGTLHRFYQDASIAEAPETPVGSCSLRARTATITGNASLYLGKLLNVACLWSSTKRCVHAHKLAPDLHCKQQM